MLSDKIIIQDTSVCELENSVSEINPPSLAQTLEKRVSTNIGTAIVTTNEIKSPPVVCAISPSGGDDRISSRTINHSTISLDKTPPKHSEAAPLPLCTPSTTTFMPQVTPKSVSLNKLNSSINRTYSGKKVKSHLSFENFSGYKSSQMRPFLSTERLAGPSRLASIQKPIKSAVKPGMFYYFLSYFSH